MGGRLEELSRELRDPLEMKTQKLATEGRQAVNETFRMHQRNLQHRTISVCERDGGREGEHLKCGPLFLTILNRLTEC